MLVSLKVQGLRAAAMVKGNFQRLDTSNLLKKKTLYTQSEFVGIYNL